MPREKNRQPRLQTRPIQDPAWRHFLDPWHDTAKPTSRLQPACQAWPRGGAWFSSGLALRRVLLGGASIGLTGRWFRRAWLSAPLAFLLVVLLAVSGSWAASSTKKKGSPKSKSGAQVLKVDIAKSQGGPTNDAPDHVLALWSDGPAVGWRAEGWQLTKQADRALAEIEKAEGAGLKSKLLDIGRVHVLLLRIGRLSEALALWSEPAAHDLEVRQDSLRQRLQSLMIAAKADPSCGHIIANHLPAFQAKVDRQAKNLPALRKEAEGNDVEDLCARVTDLHDQLAVEEIWYPRLPRGYLFDFEQLRQVLHGKIQTERNREARAAIEKFRVAQMPDYGGPLKLLDEIVASMSAGRPASIGGRNVDGPAAVAWFLDQRQELHLRAVHCWALTCPIDNSGENVWGKPEEDKAAYSGFQVKVTTGLIKIIEADAEHVAGPDVRRRYLAYLDVLAPVVSSFPAKAQMQWRPALDKLAAKDPALALELQLYRQATSGILTWRSRLAQSQAEGAKQRNPQVGDKLFKGQFTSALPELMNSLADKLLGQPLVGSDFVGVPPAGQAVSACDSQQRFFVVPLDRQIEDEAVALRSELLAAAGEQPLSLEAAVALAGATRGDLAEAGGKVQRLELEGVTTLYATADQNMGALVRSSELPNARLGSELRLKVMLDPLWYRLPYAFVDLSHDNR